VVGIDKRGDIMKTRTMLGALIMAALIGSSVGVGYAGGGDSGLGNGALLFDCYFIQDSAPPSPLLVLEVDDVFTATKNVSVGKARLLCTPADGAVVQGDLAGVDPFGAFTTCYETSPPRRASDVVTLSDSFVGSQTVRLGPAQFLCTSAHCTTGTSTNDCLPPAPPEP
jgi:hypothetical protein